MDASTLTAFAIFVAIMTGTPGPGNLTFMAIAANSGFRRAVPVILASQIGSLFLNLCVAFGLGHVMAGGGIIVTIFKGLSLAYMVYLAWKIVRLSILPKGDAPVPGFRDGLLIHPLSPKTWAMSLVAYTSFFAGNDLSVGTNAVLLTSGLIAGGTLFHSIWALLGHSILKLVGSGRLLRALTMVLAGLMLAATLWALLL